MEQKINEQGFAKQNINEQIIANQNIKNQNIMKHAVSMQELIALINDSEEDFMISIHLGEEAETDAEEEQIQG